MNKPTEEQIREVLAGTSTPETARLVAQWFATDEGTDYLSRSMDCDVEQVKLGYEELYVDHEIASDELFARIRRNIRRKRVRRIVFRVAAVLIPFATTSCPFWTGRVQTSNIKCRTAQKRCVSIRLPLRHSNCTF